MRRGLYLVICAATGCYTGVSAPQQESDGDGPPAGSGSSDSGSSDSGDADGETEGETPLFATHGGLRRLTVAEFDNALRDLLLDDRRPGAEFLPADAMAPFDNDYVGQSPSEALIVGVEKLASEAAERLLADTPRLASLRPCAPTGPSDAACLREFAGSLGRRAFRRPLSELELDGFEGLIDFGAEGDDWNLAATAVVRAMLQDPNFLYRVEVGEPVEGADDLVKLTDWEMATRLSFMLWGTIPDDALLDAARDGALSTAEQVREAAELMLADEKARATIERFHSMWLGYAGMGDSGLSADMLVESRALIDQVVFEDESPWLSLLTADETFVTQDLAEHYGLPAPADPAGGWVAYGDSGRGGILSQGTVLSLGAKFNDTSPTVRGAELRTRLFCQNVELPEGLKVNVDDPPGVDPDACKVERYAAHRESGVCAGCHALTDGLGFGLENYDATGAFRTTDPGKPQCVISGDGDVAEASKFNGPAELGEILVGLPSIKVCAVEQLYRYSSGRAELDSLDTDYLDAVVEDHPDQDIRLTDIIIEFAASDAFRFRVVGEEE